MANRDLLHNKRKDAIKCPKHFKLKSFRDFFFFNILQYRLHILECCFIAITKLLLFVDIKHIGYLFFTFLFNLFYEDNRRSYPHNFLTVVRHFCSHKIKKTSDIWDDSKLLKPFLTLYNQIIHKSLN